MKGEQTMNSKQIQADECIGARNDASWRESLVVLETATNGALLYNPSNRYTPFIVAHYFDPVGKTWSHGSYFSDITTAACALHGKIHPDHAIGGFTPTRISSLVRDRFIDPEIAEIAAAKLNGMLATELAHDMERLVDDGFIELAVIEAEEECNAPFEEAVLGDLAKEKAEESKAADPGVPGDQGLDER